MKDIPVRGWTFTHWWVRPVVKVWFHLYHKTVTYSAVDHIDWSKPIIFAPSHQSAFTDALCLILPTRYTNDRFIYPLIRADAFGNNRALDWMLTAFHMLPVYRPKDRVDIKKQNESIFADCYDILSKNRNLLVHPEGNCFALRKVRRFKKGLARIAFGAEELNDFDLDIIVIPVGINYRELTEARAGIHIQFGSPISVQDYKQAYKEHAAAAIADMTGRVEEEVKKVTVDIQMDKEYRFIDNTVKLCRNLHPDFSFASEYTQREVTFEKTAIERLEKLLADSSKKESLKQAVRELCTFLEQAELDRKRPLVGKHGFLRLAAAGISFLLLAPLFLYGWINNIIPWVLMHKPASKIEDKQFINSIRMVSGLLAFPVCYLLQTAVVGYATGSMLWTGGYLISLPLTGIISLKVSEWWKDWRQQLKLFRLSKSQKRKFKDLKKSFFSVLGLEGELAR